MRGRGEAGVTLLEVTITVAMIAAVFAIVMPMLTSAQTALVRQQARSATNDQTALAMGQLEHDIRSGNVIGAPTPVAGVAGMEVVVYTQTDGTPFRCVQYRVADGELLRRSRLPGDAESWPAQWAVVAEGIVNAVQPTPVPAFTRSADKQTMAVSLLVQADRAESIARLTTSITGRNTRYFDTPFAGEQC